MHFYTQQHQYYCWIDLHTKNMYVCIINQGGNILFHKNISSSPQWWYDPNGLCIPS